MSNPLLFDPSIITVSDGTTTSGAGAGAGGAGASGAGLEPGSALSKLLDSAMAKAASESTPEFEPRSSSTTPQPSSASTMDSPRALKNPGRIYSVEFLLSLRELPLVEEFKNLPFLPERSMWGKNLPAPKKQGNNNNNNNHHQQNNNSNNSQGKRNNKKRGNDFNFKPGFLKAEDLDSLPEDKISHLLGKPPMKLNLSGIRLT